MLLVPGTLEHYSQLGIADLVLEDTLKPDQAYIHTSRGVASFDFDKVRVKRSRFQQLYTYPQDEHEALLYQILKERGGDVQWDTEFLEAVESAESIKVKLKSGSKEIIESYEYVIGADGASSQVRKSLGIDFAGETNNRQFFVTDVEIEETSFQQNDIHAYLTKGYFTLLFPLRNKNISRLIGVFPLEMVEQKQTDINHLKLFFKETFKFTITKVHWFAPYKIHHRLAQQFRKGNSFLIGDAAHIHSPVGGQGLNAGVADAVNLSWKLAQVILQKNQPQLLDTYETERRAYAKTLVKTTDRAFNIMISDINWINRAREKVAPTLANLIINQSAGLKENLLGRITQLHIHYKDSPLNAGDSKLSGRRLPHYQENSQLTDSMNWQLHIYGTLQKELKSFLKQYPQLEVHLLEWEDPMTDAGFKKDAAYLVQPDGYIAWTSHTQDQQALADYLNKWC